MNEAQREAGFYEKDGYWFSNSSRCFTRSAAGRRYSSLNPSYIFERGGSFFFAGQEYFSADSAYCAWSFIYANVFPRQQKNGRWYCNGKSYATQSEYYASKSNTSSYGTGPVKTEHEKKCDELEALLKEYKDDFGDKFDDVMERLKELKTAPEENRNQKASALKRKAQQGLHPDLYPERQEKCSKLNNLLDYWK
ncbi:MAG: hypothetical protein KDK48_03720 [Chlamydiia bacterium]|nr:hypothetical protein [Chlamydiia bacterium]